MKHTVAKNQQLHDMTLIVYHFQEHKLQVDSRAT